MCEERQYIIFLHGGCCFDNIVCVAIGGASNEYGVVEECDTIHVG